jgi:hypothetical protein
MYIPIKLHSSTHFLAEFKEFFVPAPEAPEDLSGKAGAKGSTKKDGTEHQKRTFML